MASPPPAAEARPRRWRWIGWLAGTVAVVGALAAAAVVSALHSRAGLGAVLVALDRVAPGVVRVDGLVGRLDDEFGARQVVVTAGATRVEIDALRAKLASVRLRPIVVRFATLKADRVVVTVAPSPDGAATDDSPPASIASPVEVDANDLAIGDLAVATGADGSGGLALQNVGGRDIESGPRGYRIGDGRLTWSGHPARLWGTLGGAAPFPIRASAIVEGVAVDSVQHHPVAVALGAGGSLVDLALAAQVASGDAHGTVAARAASFAAAPLRALQANLRGLDPADWVDGAPHALLAIDADLAPSARPAAGAGIALRGRAHVANDSPGTIDAGKVPLRDVATGIAIDQGAGGALHVALDGLDARIGSTARGNGKSPEGQLTGQASFDAGKDGPLGWRADLGIHRVDLASIDSRLRALVVDGTAKAGRDGEAIAADAQLAAQGASLAAKLRARPDAVDVEHARLALGPGSLEASGRWRRADGRVVASGSASRLDLSRLLANVRTDLNGRFDVDGIVGSRPSGHASVALEPSRVCVVDAARCVAARGSIAAQVETTQLKAAQRLVVDADLAAGSATLRAHGAVVLDPGRPKAPPRAEDLTIDLVVPALQDFEAGATGALRLHAQASGSWPHPKIDAQLHGDRLAWQGRSAASVEVAWRDAGDVDGELHGQVVATTVHPSPSDPNDPRPTVIKSVDAALDGRWSAHALRLKATTDAGQAIDVEAQGGLAIGASSDRRTAAAEPVDYASLGAEKLAWRGELRRLDAGGSVPVHLVSPAAAGWDRAGESIGPATLDAAGGHFDDVEIVVRDGAIRTRGTFHDLHPFHTLKALDTVSPANAEPQTLALDGNWHLQLGPEANRADGEIAVARSGGDLVAPTPSGMAPLGITEIGVHVKLDAARFDVDGALQGQRVGHARVRGQGELARGAGAFAWRLAPARPFSLALDADLPTIGDLAPLLGDALRSQIRFGGRLTANLQVDGTPESPHARGRVDGQDLRVAWIDQGVRLENGTLAVVIDDTTVRLEQLKFSGTPRLKPFEPRAAARIDVAQAGFVTASGSFDLHAFDGTLTVRAERLPLLQRPDRWVLVSGDGDVALSRERAQLHGAFKADGGAIDFSRSELPSLSPDVTVRTAGGPAGPAPARTLVALDLTIDLGPAFYLRGRGLETRAEGALRLRSDGSGPIRGVGAVSAQDGTFEGFGQKLSIQRGRVDFQGALDNPGLDILALRAGLPVNVGVTITGTASQPLVRVYSDPPLPDYEALSWLALGRPPDQSGNDNLAIASAAAGLLGGTGPGLPTRLARELGIDQLSVRSGEFNQPNSLLPTQSVAGPLNGNTNATTTSQIVSVGKRINNAMTISYEQVAGGTASVVQLSYQLSRRLSLLARAGTDNALDLVWTLSFD